MINAYIEKVREKPEQHRRRVALMWTGVGTMVVAVLWFVNFQIITQVNNEAQTAAVAEVKAPLAGVSETLAEEWGQVGAGWDRLQGIVAPN